MSVTNMRYGGVVIEAGSKGDSVTYIGLLLILKDYDGSGDDVDVANDEFDEGIPEAFFSSSKIMMMRESEVQLKADNHNHFYDCQNVGGVVDGYYSKIFL